MACLQWGPCCHPPAFLLAEGKLCSVKHAPKASFILHKDKMGKDKKIFLERCHCCTSCAAPGKVCFPQPRCCGGKVIKAAGFSHDSGVSVAGSELPLRPVHGEQGVGLAGEVAQEPYAFYLAGWSCSGGVS